MNPAGLNILLVEDHPDTAALLRSYLERRGHRVALAGTRQEALSHPGLARMPSACVTCSGTVTLEEAYPGVLNVAHFAREPCYLSGPAFEEKTTRLAQLCEELQSYIWNNREALIDYGQRQRDGQPISTAGAEGTVNQLVNARLNRGDQMRWSARGAHRVLQVRAAILDGRLHPETPPAAA